MCNIRGSSSRSISLFLLGYSLFTGLLFTFSGASSEFCEKDNCPESQTTKQEIKMANTERTFIAVKPDGVQRGLVGDITKRFEQRGYKLVGMKMVHASEDHLKIHYEDLKSKPFFAGLVKYMASGPVVAMVWEGKDVVKQGRAMLGATNPLASAPGTIRGDFCIDLGRNICHGSDAVESAKKEIDLWFKPEELVNWKRSVDEWIYE